MPRCKHSVNFETKKKIFAERLILWHKNNKRNFEWRRTKDPYKILIAEMMLQKTDALKVENVYSKFIKKYSDPYILANSDVLEIENDIYLLGIRKRAERFKKMADTVVNKFGGKVPETKSELMSILGVGDYIANAVLCFAYEKDAPLLDTNILRILGRVFNIKSKKTRPRTDKKMWEIVESMIPTGKAKELNLATLDFSAKICTLKNPKHEECPVKDICDYYIKEEIL